MFRDQDLAEALDSGGSDMEMERGIVQVQEASAQHRAKMWKVRSMLSHRTRQKGFGQQWRLQGDNRQNIRVALPLSEAKMTNIVHL